MARHAGTRRDTPHIGLILASEGGPLTMFASARARLRCINPRQGARRTLPISGPVGWRDRFEHDLVLGKGAPPFRGYQNPI